jgi:glycosyltransferase involved in cell wall biosynthesis
MVILQVSSSDSGGGAEGIAWNLFEAYQAMGESSWLAVGQKRTSSPRVVEIPNLGRRNWWSRLCLSAGASLKKVEAESRAAWVFRRVLASVGDPVRSLNHLRGYEDFRFPGTDMLLELVPEAPQILHCHNLHGAYFDLRQVSQLSLRLPVMLTLHDAWLTTGHCAHSLNCGRWTDGCGQCPDLTLYPALLRDATAHNWKVKQRIYSHSRLYVATPSKWLMDRVDNSMLRPGIVESRVIPNGVDLQIFKPGDVRYERDRLGLPQDANILMFAAFNTRVNAWKDFSTLRAAVLQIAAKTNARRIVFIAIGEQGVTERIGNAEIRYIGPIFEKQMMAAYYRASDLYLHAARADTFPNSVLEAQACGNPVVATAVGGIPEQVVDGSTGRLTRTGDSGDLAAAIEQLLASETMRRQMGARAAERVRLLYDLKTQAAAYRDWQRDILSSR